jgi:hypothetical protein
VYPYPLVDWFQGVKTYGQNVLFQPAWQGFVPTWITRPQTPFLLVTLAVPAVMAAATLRHRPEGVSLLRWIASLVVAVFSGWDTRLQSVSYEKPADFDLPRSASFGVAPKLDLSPSPNEGKHRRLRGSPGNHPRKRKRRHSGFPWPVPGGV